MSPPLSRYYGPSDAGRQARGRPAGAPLRAQGRQLAERAEIELSTMAGQRLDRATLEPEVAAWEAGRNALGGTVQWQCTTEEATINPERLHPSVDA